MLKFGSRGVLILLLILILAGFLRFYGLGKADVITDEALISFRAIGYIDFFVSPYQTTPYEWFSDIPTWAKLSFHDHPPLIFIIQNFFFKLFGQTLFALRIPFALAGLFSVWLLYLIGKKLFSQQVGLLASLFLAVSSYHVWISRIGLQESVVIVLSLLTFYLFLKALDNQQHWRWGLALGLAMLAKYTAGILLPLFLIYLLIYHRSVFKDKRFWLAVILLILVFSPVLIYNLNLYAQRGHFDLQLSYLLGQKVSEWEFLPGKIKAGSLTDKLFNFIPSFYKGLLGPMFIIFTLGFIYAIYYFWKQKNRSVFWLILAIILYSVLFLLIGPAKRFVIMVVPFLVLLIAWFIWQQKKFIKYPLIVLLIGIEIFFTVNTLLVNNSFGQENITYSYVRRDSRSWGYNQLNTYLVQLLNDKRPGVTFTPQYNFLEDIKKAALARAEQQNKSPAEILIVYDANMYDLAMLWIFHRQLIYQAWPIVTADDYLDQEQDFWINQGVKEFYFFKIIDPYILQQPEPDRTQGAEILANQLTNLNPEIIKRPDGREVFAVYNWQ